MTTDNRRWLVLLAIWILAAIAILPAIFHWAAPAPATGSARYWLLAAGYCAAAALCYGIFRIESKRLARRPAIVLILVIILLTSIVNNIHSFYIDHSSQYFITLSNHDWQVHLQQRVILLSPEVLPHSYRFLPNAIVRWLELAGFSFDDARDVFRWIFGLALFYSLYRFARLYCSYGTALIAMLLIAVIYPVSFEHYAGQLTDPVSHLSFALAFIFLETGEFALLLSTLVIGSLAKETVLAMAGYYVIANWKEKHYVVKAITLCAAVVAAYTLTRVYVLHGAMNYKQVSGVSLDQIRDNWQDNDKWLVPFLLTACVLLPFLVLAWKETPAALKRLTLFLFPVLFVSSFLFSWLRETRNFMPLVFVLAVVAARYLSSTASKNEALP